MGGGIVAGIIDVAAFGMTAGSVDLVIAAAGPVFGSWLGWVISQYTCPDKGVISLTVETNDMAEVLDTCLNDRWRF